MQIPHQTKRVLQAVQDLPDGEAYGLALSRASGLKSGALYPLLDRLRDEGWLSAHWEEVDEEALEWHAHMYYRLTDLGQTQVGAVVADKALGPRDLMPGS